MTHTLAHNGNLALLDLPAVSIVGTRTPTAEGIARARKVADVAVSCDLVVISGLAKGIDTAAHEQTLARNGQTIAVLGTPIDRIYPAENKALATRIAREGLLLSAALPNEQVGKYLFPRRNKLMAQLSLATIVIEAGETSGVRHQAAECLRQSRRLFFLKSILANEHSWIAESIAQGAHVVASPNELTEWLRRLNTV